MRVVLAAILGHNSVAMAVVDLLSPVEKDGLNKAEVFLVVIHIIGHGVEGVVVHNEVVGVVLLHAADSPAEIVRSCDFQGVSQVEVVVVGVVVRNDAPEPLELGHHPEDAHGLGPAVAVGALGGEEELVAEPFGELVVEEDHAGVHVDAALVVEQLVPEDVGHGGPFGKAAGLLHVVDSLQQVVAEWESLFGDVMLGPDFELKIGVFQLVEFQDLALDLRHLAVNPNQMEHFRNKLGFGALGVRFVLQGRVEDCELLH